MKILLAIVAIFVSQAFAAEGEMYTKGKPDKEITKIEAMRELLLSKNQAQIYKCVLVELSNKGTVKNK